MSALDWAYSAKVQRYPFDPTLAGELLDRAGYPRQANGIRLSVAVPYGETFDPVAQVVRRNLAAVGVELQLEPLEWYAAVERGFTRADFQLGIWNYDNGADPDVSTPDAYLSSNIGPIPWGNAAGYVNPEVDALFDRAARGVNRTLRAQAYDQIQTILVRDLPMLWLTEINPARAF